MRRGLLGVRLCDRSACPERWPCVQHGTASVGDYEHLGRHAGAFELAVVDMRGGLGLDMRSCGACGYALCSCERLDALPEGWILAVDHPNIDDQESYRHTSGASVWRYYETGKVACYSGWGWLWSSECGGGCERSKCKPTRNAAMVAALACGVADVLQVKTSTNGCAWTMERDESALQPGWTTDGESYFNDAIALMVCRDTGGRWRIYGNGEPWPQGYVRPGRAWVDARNAMYSAAIHAGNCARERAEHPVLLAW